ncbi:MAG: fasciclin domain-containing protein [Deltaproteobacteria bacterium]|nr:fasciclin domain-containing protein [Deltaproteobacteria bacterium]
MVALVLGGAACKKKEGAEAGKPVEGSGAATGSGAASGADPAAGSAGSAAGSAAAGSAAAGSAAAGSAAAPDPVAGKDLLTTAKEAGNFTTLLKAIDAAGLTDTLGKSGPFTVFAPTDEAFAKVPAKDLEALLADKAKLTAVLQYHVVSGAVLAKDLAGQKEAKSILGPALPLDTTSGVKIGGATVTRADIVASNGVIHVIDTVLLPPQ